MSAPVSPLRRRSGHVDGVASCGEARRSGSLWSVCLLEEPSRADGQDDDALVV